MGATWIDARDPALRLRCPTCHAAIAHGAPDWQCAGIETHGHSEIDGVPVLLNAARSLFRDDDFRPGARTTFKQPARWALWLGNVLPSPSRDVSAAHCRRRLTRLLADRPPGCRRVLIVGCGDGSACYGDLAAVDGSRWLETDVSLAGPARIVCDASDLPFADAQFDLVICVAVLEHVLEPQRCVDEMRRVLADDGMVYAVTPFMQQVHMAEYDFTRYTRSGHRWLFRGFEQIDSGVATGPASVLIWSVQYFLLSWTASVSARRVIKGLTRLLFGWITLLDVLLARRAAANDGAGGFYFIGRRAAADAVTPRAMVGHYRGGDAIR